MLTVAIVSLFDICIKWNSNPYSSYAEVRGFSLGDLRSAPLKRVLLPLNSKGERFISIIISCSFIPASRPQYYIEFITEVKGSYSTGKRPQEDAEHVGIFSPNSSLGIQTRSESSHSYPAIFIFIFSLHCLSISVELLHRYFLLCRHGERLTARIG